MNRPRRLQCCKCWREGVPPTWLVVCGALLVQVGFGLYPVVLKEFAAKEKANPVILSFYRDVCCIPVLFLCSIVAERKFLIPKLRMLIIFILMGLSGMFANQYATQSWGGDCERGYQLLYILGVYWAGPNIASAFQPVVPVWTAILAILTCVERVPSPLHLHTWAKVIGILMATGGAIELTLTGIDADSNSNSTDCTNTTGSSNSGSCNSPAVSLQVLGYIALFGNTICMSTYVLLQKRFIFNSPGCKWKQYPVTITAYSYFFGALFMGLSTIYFAATGQGDQFRIPQNSLYAIVYAVFITSALCFLLITWSNLHLSSTIATSFWPFQVLVTVVSSYFITGDKLANWQYAGVVILLVALMLVLFANHMEERLIEGHKVIRLDYCCAESTQSRKEEEKVAESSPLLSSHSSHKYSDEDEEPSMKKHLLN